jgi:hypothetical protein
VPQELDVPHSYSAIGDTARTLVVASRNEQAYGRASQISIQGGMEGGGEKLAGPPLAWYAVQHEVHRARKGI